jgi:hypothetical protein
MKDQSRFLAHINEKGDQKSDCNDFGLEICRPERPPALIGGQDVFKGLQREQGVKLMLGVRLADSVR